METGLVGSITREGVLEDPEGDGGGGEGVWTEALVETSERSSEGRLALTGGGGGGIKTVFWSSKASSGVNGIRPLVSKFFGRRRFSSVKT